LQVRPVDLVTGQLQLGGGLGKLLVVVVFAGQRQP